MKKRWYILSFLLVIFAAITVLLILKHEKGTKLVHYKQYFLPGQGQIVGRTGTIQYMQLYFYDEEEISEIYEPENIKSMILLGENGEVVETDDWRFTVLDSKSIDYPLKTVEFSFNVKEKIEVNKLVVTYIDDVAEEFDIGNISINLVDNQNMNVSIRNNVGRIAAGSEIYDPTKNLYNQNRLSYLTTMIRSNADKYVIVDIDMGIQGIGLDSSTVKSLGISDTLVIDKEFRNEPENDVYKDNGTVNELSKGEFDIRLQNTDNSFENFIMSIEMSEDFRTGASVLYIHPVYTILNEETGEKFEGVASSCQTLCSKVVNNDYALELLEEFGQ